MTSSFKLYLNEMINYQSDIKRLGANIREDLFGELPKQLQKLSNTSISPKEVLTLIILGHKNPTNDKELIIRRENPNKQGIEAKREINLRNSQRDIAYQEGQRRAKITPYDKEMYLDKSAKEEPEYIKDYLEFYKHHPRAINDLNDYKRLLERIEVVKNEIDVIEVVNSLKYCGFLIYRENDANKVFSDIDKIKMPFIKEFFKRLTEIKNKRNIMTLMPIYDDKYIEVLGDYNKEQEFKRLIDVFQLSGKIFEHYQKIFDNAKEQSEEHDNYLIKRFTN